MADKNKSGDFYDRPEKVSGWAGFTQFIWNGESKQFMGRTGISWAKILLFYLIFYTVLSIFFMTLWFIFAGTLKDDRPKYEREESCIGNVPGLGYRPMPPESNVESTLIWYQRKNTNNSQYWVDEIERFLQPFKQQSTDASIVDCNKYGPKGGDACKVNVESNFGRCVAEKKYGYEEGQPCIFLKLNKIFNWVPAYYNRELYDRNSLPEEMPNTLKDHIMSSSSASNATVIWVSCEGERPADKENIGANGTIKYHSMTKEQGFFGNFFPYTRAKHYLQPLVAVQFTDITPGVLVNIECKVWSPSINHHLFERKDRKGAVHFEILIDDPPKVKKN